MLKKMTELQSFRSKLLCCILMQFNVRFGVCVFKQQIITMCFQTCFHYMWNTIVVLVFTVYTVWLHFIFIFTVLNFLFLLQSAVNPLYIVINASSHILHTDQYDNEPQRQDVLLQPLITWTLQESWIFCDCSACQHLGSVWQGSYL